MGDFGEITIDIAQDFDKPINDEETEQVNDNQTANKRDTFVLQKEEKDQKKVEKGFSKHLKATEKGVAVFSGPIQALHMLVRENLTLDKPEQMNLPQGERENDYEDNYTLIGCCIISVFCLPCTFLLFYPFILAFLTVYSIQIAAIVLLSLYISASDEVQLDGSNKGLTIGTYVISGLYVLLIHSTNCFKIFKGFRSDNVAGLKNLKIATLEILLDISLSTGITIICMLFASKFSANLIDVLSFMVIISWITEVDEKVTEFLITVFELEEKRRNRIVKKAEHVANRKCMDSEEYQSLNNEEKMECRAFRLEEELKRKHHHENLMSILYFLTLLSCMGCLSSFIWGCWNISSKFDPGSVGT